MVDAAIGFAGGDAVGVQGRLPKMSTGTDARFAALVLKSISGVRVWSNCSDSRIKHLIGRKAPIIGNIRRYGCEWC